MTAQLLVVSIDSMDVDLADEMMAAGDLPVLAALSERAAVVDTVSECFDYLPGGLWYETHSGVRSWRTGLYQSYGQTFSGEAESRKVQAGDVDLAGFWFNMADAAGMAVCLVDPTSAPRREGFAGTEVDQYGIHELHWDPHVQPEELRREVDRIGPYPVRLCDLAVDGSDRSLRRLVDDYRVGVARKGAVAAAAVGLADHDVAYVTFAEPHCIGHQLWHHHDPASPWRRHDPPRDLARTVREFYAHTDTNLGRVIDAAGPGARVIVQLSHGMRHQLSGPQLLPPLVEHLGLGTGAPPFNRYRHLVPYPLRQLAKRLVPRSVIDRHQLDKRELSAPGTRAMSVQNNQVGAIRLGVKGREPAGEIEPADLPGEIARLSETVSGMVQPSSGERITAEVIDTRERWGRDCHPNIPDLLVRFRRDLGPLEVAVLPDGATITAPVHHDTMTRTGDHVPRGRLVVHHPGRDLSGVHDTASNVDVGPTVMACLGLAVPDGLDGRPIETVVGAFGDVVRR